MKTIFIQTLCLFAVSHLYGQSRAMKFDIMTGIHKPIGSLDLDNRFGWRLGGGLRYSFENKSSINILQVTYDKFIQSSTADIPYQNENGKSSNTLALLTGYSYPVFKRTYIGGNAGVGFVGDNRANRVTKFGVNPFISFEPLREVYVDFGWLNFWGGYRSTTYLNFNLRYSF